MPGIEINDNNFETEVIKSQVPVLLDFWAPWCGPCRMLSPVVAELASEFEGRAKVGKVNTDESPETASKFQISAIPTLLFFKDGEVVEQLVGVRPKPEIKSILEKLF